MAALMTQTLDPYESKTRGIEIEPHPAQWVEVKPNKKGERFKVYAWRMRCTHCGLIGLGWPQPVSTEAQARDHATACPSHPLYERP